MIENIQDSKMNNAIVTIKKLNFEYEKGNKNIIDLNCIIPEKAKVILVGANGAGKSTLLRILTGQIFMNLDAEEFDINGNGSPNDQHNGVAYLGGSWKRRRTGFEGICPYTMDIRAGEMMEKWQEEFIERRDELVRILGINLNWRMHECSDGQRKKVRIMIKLLRPFKFCVIDEFAADLDIFSRSRFFDYLSKECELRKASVIYCTHIFDHADTWASHIAFMQLNKTLSPVHDLRTYGPYQEILLRTGSKRSFCPMYTLVLEELERQYRDNTELFIEDNKCLSDVIMDLQGKEEEGNHNEISRDKGQHGWVEGRLARELAIKSMEEEKKKNKKN